MKILFKRRWNDEFRRHKLYDTMHMSGIYNGSLFCYVGSLLNAIPTYVFIAFQMMFALITPALISGSVAGRMRFKAFFIFIALWSIVVYYPLAHMVWGEGGLLGEGWLKAVDFAGGNVVHISSGVTGLD